MKRIEELKSDATGIDLKLLIWRGEFPVCLPTGLTEHLPSFYITLNSSVNWISCFVLRPHVK